MQLARSRLAEVIDPKRNNITFQSVGVDPSLQGRTAKASRTRESLASLQAWSIPSKVNLCQSLTTKADSQYWTLRASCGPSGLDFILHSVAGCPTYVLAEGDGQAQSLLVVVDDSVAPIFFSFVMNNNNNFIRGRTDRIIEWVLRNLWLTLCMLRKNLLLENIHITF